MSTGSRFSHERWVKYHSTAASALFLQRADDPLTVREPWTRTCRAWCVRHLRSLLFLRSMFTVALKLCTCCKCQGNFSLLLTQMPQSGRVAKKGGLFKSTDFNVSYYLHVAVCHDHHHYQPVCLGIYPAHHSMYYEGAPAQYPLLKINSTSHNGKVKRYSTS